MRDSPVSAATSDTTAPWSAAFWNTAARRISPAKIGKPASMIIPRASSASRDGLGGQIVSGPITYQVGGKQYVAVIAGNNLVAFALRD